MFKLFYLTNLRPNFFRFRLKIFFGFDPNFFHDSWRHPESTYMYLEPPTNIKEFY